LTFLLLQSPQTTSLDDSGLGDLYLLAMDAIHHVAPEVPFFLEGTGQSGIGANWGDGFATDAQLIRDHGLSDPNSFFQVILLMYCSASWIKKLQVITHQHGLFC